MFEIKRRQIYEYVCGYEYKSRNSLNQIMVCEIYLTTAKYINVSFYICDKRKTGYARLKSTGRDGIRSLLWAKSCIADFISFARTEHKGHVIRVYADDEKRRKVYEWGLAPLGFKTMYNRHKCLYLKL